MYALYTAVSLVLLVVLLPRFVYQALRYRKYVTNLRQRLGYLPVSFNVDGEESIWIHAVSVGEALAARALAAELKKRYPSLRLFVSTTTVTGQQVASREIGEADAVFYFPLDFPLIVTRTLRLVNPRLFVMVETEIWPNLLRACRRAGREDGRRERADLDAVVPALSARAAAVQAGPGGHRPLLHAVARVGRPADRPRRRPGARQRHRQPEVRFVQGGWRRAWLRPRQAARAPLLRRARGSRRW